MAGKSGQLEHLVKFWTPYILGASMSASTIISLSPIGAIRVFFFALFLISRVARHKPEAGEAIQRDEP